MQPKISVCIPVYNTAGFLVNCLKSVVNQTMKEIEIICVEDASSDSSGRILKEYAEKDPRIRIIWHEENAGLVKTRKDAVLSAQGKYIMFLDSDDELFPNACEVAFKAIENNKTDAVRFGVQSIDSQGLFRVTSKFLHTERLDRVEDKNWLYLYQKELLKGWTIWNKIYNADLCKIAYKQMEDDYLVMAEDVYFSFIYGYFAKSFSMIENVLYKYRQGFGVWSGIQKRISLEKYRILLSEKRALDAILRFYETKPNSNEYELIITKYVKHVFLRQSVLWWHDNLQDQDKVEGLNVFKEVWGEENYSFALSFLSDTMSARIRNMNKDKARLQKEKLNLENEKKRLQKKLTSIKESRGYKVLRKLYRMRDAVKTVYPAGKTKEEKVIPVPGVLTTTDNKVSFINWWPWDSHTEWFYLFIKNNTAVNHINMFSVFGDKNRVTKYANKKDVFFSGENLDIKLGKWDAYTDYCLDYVGLSMGFAERNEANYLRFPLWLVYMFEPVIDKDRIAERVNCINRARNTGKYECSLIARHDWWNTRTPIYEALKNELEVLCAGKWNNNTSILWDEFKDNKIEFLNNCKFTICAENSDAPHYVTEKLFEAFLGGCIPIYAGAGAKPEPDIINPDAVLLWECGNPDNNEAVIKKVRELNRDEVLYAEFLSRTKLLPGTVDYVYSKFLTLKERLAALDRS